MTRSLSGWVSSGPGVRLDVIGTRDRFLALEGPWNALFERCGRPQHVFQTFNWLWHWSNHFLDERVALAIVAAWEDDRLVMVWPLVRRRSAGGVVKLSWMGEPLSQYGDVLVEEGPHRAELLRQGWAVVGGMAADLVSLRKVRGDSVVASLLSGLNGLRTELSEAPFVNLRGSPDFAAFEKRYSGKKRSTRRRLLRRLQDSSRVAFETHVEGQRALDCVRLALGWKKAWLAETGHVSPALQDLRSARLFEDIAIAPARRTAIRVSAVTCDDAPAAVEVSFTCKGAVFGHMLAYDPRYANQGIGVVLAAHSLRTALDDGYSTFDMLAPRDDYKMDWADGTVVVEDHAVPLSLKGHLYARLWLVAARPLAKRLLRRLPTQFRRPLSGPLRKRVPQGDVA